MVDSEALFPEKARTDMRRIRSAESDYVFLDRVGGGFFANIRSVLNQWFARFAELQDDPAVRDLRNRFRAKQKGQFSAAFWELYLHELFVCLGFAIEVHPEAERGKRPDFVMERRGERIYLEAVKPAPAMADRNQTGNAGAVIEYIEEAFHPEWRLSLRKLVPGRQTPRKVAVRDAVVGWLNTQNADDWLERQGGPATNLRVGDWQIMVRGFPLAPERRGDAPKRMIWSGPGGAGYPEALGRPLARILTEKANKYGDLDAALVIAMWVDNWMADLGTAPLALFGSSLGDLKPGVERTGLDLGVERQAGLWTPDAKGRGRASAVLAAYSFGGFGLPGVAGGLPHLWHNPRADIPLGAELPFEVSRVSRDEATVENIPPTATGADLFGLPEDWPGEQERLT